MPVIYQKFTEAILDNAFNKLEKSNESINQLLSDVSVFSDSLALKLYKTKADNSIKLFDYKGAKNTLQNILINYRILLSADEVKDMENDLILWTALEHEPKQKVIINQTNRLKMTTDKAGLKNLNLYVGKDTVDFIFDTGANLSTVLEKTAKKLNMNIIPEDIEVGTITGQKIIAHIAVCPVIHLGTIEIQNAVFLVFKNDALNFPEINYQINGILGYPIIAALHEIQITQDGYFTVPNEETKIKYKSNMAMKNLVPLIYIDGRHFTFDTGADNTLLYRAYYLEKQKEIDKKYQPTKIHFGGAAGTQEFDGYMVTESFNIMDKSITLKDIQLLKDKINSDETVYGNIGQDVIKKFNKMTLNFRQMFIKFD